jgi:hypothetical protein
MAAEIPGTPGSTEEQQAGDRAAIRQAALDYAQGWYDGDVERVRRCLHPQVAKRRILRQAHTGAERVRQVSKELMVHLTQQGGGSGDVPADRRAYDITILDVCDDIASVRAESVEYVDYLHLARSQGSWVIVNVLYRVKATLVWDDGTTSWDDATVSKE